MFKAKTTNGYLNFFYFLDVILGVRINFGGYPNED